MEEGRINLGLGQVTQQNSVQPKPIEKKVETEQPKQKKTLKESLKTPKKSHEENITNIAKDIVKISESIEKKQKQMEKIQKEINTLKVQQIEKEEEAQDLIKEHLKELKKAIK